MAQTVVDIVVKASGVNKLDQVDAKAKKSAKSVDNLGRSINRLGRALAGLAVGDQLRRAFGAAAELSGTEQRINNVTKKYQQFIGIQNSAAQASKNFAISQQQALSDFSDLASRLGSSGASLRDLENIYSGFNTLLLENAVGAQQAAAAQLQLNQALGSGRLAGEEFNAINEATPQLLDEVANVLGVARGELKQLAADGKITSQTLIQALTNIRTQGAENLANALDTPAGKLRQFDAAVKDFQVTIGQELLPVITPFIVEMTKLLKLFGELPGPVKAALVGLTALVAAAAALGPLFGVIAGGAKALGGGLLALGAGGSAAAGALSLTTKALLVLKGLLIAMPWVAAAAGLGLLVVETVKYINKKKELNKLMNASETMSDDLAGAQSKLKTEIERVKGEIENANNKMEDQIGKGKRGAAQAEVYRKKIEELTKQLQLMEGEYNVVIKIQEIREKFGIDSANAAPGTRGRQAGINQRRAEAAAEAARKALQGTGTSGSSGGGGGGAAPTDDIAGLQAQKQLLEQIAPIQERINEAKLAGDQMLVTRLEGEKQRLELIAQGEEAVKNMNTEEGKSLQAAINNLKLNQQSVEVQQQLAELKKQQAEAIQGITQPLQDELELLQAKLDGNEDEIKQLQEIRDLKKQILELDPNADTSGIEAMVRQRDAMREQVAEMEKTKELVGQISGTIASEFTGAIRSVIDGTKSAEEAMSDMLKGIGEAFVNMALKIIEQQIQMIINGLIMKALGIGGGLGGGGFGSGASAPSIGTSTNYFGGGFTPMNFFADGGYPPLNEVSVVGERGPELFVPDQPGRIISHEQSKAAMSMYSPSNQEMAATAQAPANYAFNTIRIADEEYVSSAQLKQAMSKASADGAKQGEQRAMNRLRQSRSTRSKIGI